MTPPGRLELLTMCDGGFLPQALVLQRSLQRHGRPFRLRVLCMDSASERLMTARQPPGVETVSLAELEEFDPELAARRGERSWLEYCWTATPSFCRFGLDRAEADVVLWVDADLEFYRDPRELVDELGEGSILLTPHNYYRTYPSAAPPEYLTEQWGRFNGGTVLFRDDEQGRAAVELWRERTLEWCYDRLEPGLFGNQMHLVDFTDRFSAARILQVPGGGLGPWSSGQYRIGSNGDGITAEGDSVVFYHHQSLRLLWRPWRLRGVPLPSNMFVLSRRRPALVARANPRYRISREERRLIVWPYLRRLAEAASEVAEESADSDRGDALALVHIVSDLEQRLRIRAGNIRHRVKRVSRAGRELRERPRQRSRHRSAARSKARMKVTAISMVRNEADVIEAFVRHNAQVVDELVVVDHRSVDGTDEVLEALAAEGLPVKVRSERSPVQAQNAVLTPLMREAAGAGRSDWVIPLDADEFLVAPSGGVREVLAELGDKRPWAVDMRLYVPTAEDPADEPNVLRRVRHRREMTCDVWTRKALIPGRWAAQRRFPLAQGNHALEHPRTGRFVSPALTDGIALAHFPVRSPRQLAAKVLGGWPAHLARPDCHPDGAWQWKRAFETVAAGEELTDREFEALAVDYAAREPGTHARLVLDPVPAPFELRYPVSREPTPLELLAETAVGLAEELGETLRRAPEHDSDPRTRRRRRAEALAAARRRLG